MSFISNIPEVPKRHGKAEKIAIFVDNLSVEGSFTEKAVSIYVVLTGSFTEEELNRVSIDRQVHKHIQKKFHFSNLISFLD